ncbi:MAG: GAF domain-containing protein [Planktothrix sp. GU0601_MAG3]|nr:MAG: GAF domain-containing protein [Planktothrix sp. GU0601_MAG3]
MNARFLGQTMFSPEGNNLSQVIHRFAEIPFDDLTHLASHLAQTPVALITFMDERHQWLKSQVGLTGKIHPYLNFCEFIIELYFPAELLTEEQDDRDNPARLNGSNSNLKPSPEPIIIPDTWNDQRFASQPLVKQDPKIRFYLGIPLMTADHLMVGMLSIIDYQPRELTPATIKALQALNNQIISQINLHRQLIHSKTKLSQLEDIINERKQVWDVVRQERDFVCAVLDTVSALVIVLDPEGRIIRFNRTCETTDGIFRRRSRRKNL